ncbi:MAG: 7-carboxy-7-deazaguanine synthase QueE [Bryobacterales bacterium]|nr:7-carboxy-7-deazaguanine synthase QueE [Bryobacterales bacterium]
MKIAEIFYSIQGEGGLVGVPSVFVRTSGCNLRCVWCDTPYTSWTPEGEDLDVAAIVRTVQQHKAATHVVLTGGEPMIAPQIVELSQQLAARRYHVTIETAGTVWQPVACHLMSISPKLQNSTPHERDGGRWAAQHDRLRIQLDVLKDLMAGYPHQLKFVVEKPEDLDEITELCAQLEADPRNVLLMPEGRDAGILRERAIWLAEVCKQQGYRLSPRLHVDLWGDRRGV